MPKLKTHIRIIMFLALAGTLFAGYLSANKLFTGTCAFNESCPYFLGYPACWYGFAMFLAMFVVALLGFRGKLDAHKTFKITLAIASVGIVFAGSFVVQELLRWLSAAGTPGYGLVLPTCVYGLVFYVAIFIVSLKMFRGSRNGG